MEDKWRIDSVEVRGGFLNDVSLKLPMGLTCIIGPRGSGKSTFAEALRFGLTGIENAPKQRADLFRANLNRTAVTIKTVPREDGSTYTVRREGRQPALLTNQDGRALSSVDMDRGTFLPFEAYSSQEIEEIAEERLGSRRRLLLDELRPDDIQGAQSNLAAARRDLEGNADQIRSARRRVADTHEKIQALAESRDLLATLRPIKVEDGHTALLQSAAQQEQFNRVEANLASTLREAIARITEQVEALEAEASQLLTISEAPTASQNFPLGHDLEGIVSVLRGDVARIFTGLRDALTVGDMRTVTVQARLAEAHLQHEASYAELRERNKEVGQAIKERNDAEEAVRNLEKFELQLQDTQQEEQRLLGVRKGLRSKYLHVGEHISALREDTARQLEDGVVNDVRIRVRRSGDPLEYHQIIANALPGAGVRNHESIVEAVAQLRPDQLAQLIASRDYDEFDAEAGLGPDRSHRVLDALRSAIDPLNLELVRPDDVVIIELNVGTPGAPLYKDASELSRGQKCTALLPLLLARRRTPLLIDQPEDNLDNHFIYRTVVDSIQRLKGHRQMIFITHNANIPVLAEADLVVVMGSDGKVGGVVKHGGLNECQQEIIDLLEGGKEAFDRRRQRYEQ